MEFKKMMLALFAFLVTTLNCYSQGFEIEDPNIIFKDKNGVEMPKDSVKSFVKKGKFSVSYNKLSNGKTEMTIFRESVKTTVTENEDNLKSKLLNKEFPKFQLKLISNKSINESYFENKITVLNFWFTGCAPCKVEIPELNKLTEELDSVNFVAFSFNKPEDISKYLVKTPFKYEQIPNAKEFITKLGITNYPTHIILDKKGIIREVIVGGENVYEKIKKTIENINVKK